MSEQSIDFLFDFLILATVERWEGLVWWRWSPVASCLVFPLLFLKSCLDFLLLLLIMSTSKCESPVPRCLACPRLVSAVLPLPQSLSSPGLPWSLSVHYASFYALCVWHVEHQVLLMGNFPHLRPWDKSLELISVFGSKKKNNLQVGPTSLGCMCVGRAQCCPQCNGKMASNFFFFQSQKIWTYQHFWQHYTAVFWSLICWLEQSGSHLTSST